MPVDHGRPSPFKACHIVNGGRASSFCSANLCWNGNVTIVFGRSYRHPFHTSHGVGKITAHGGSPTGPTSCEPPSTMTTGGFRALSNAGAYLCLEVGARRAIPSQERRYWRHWGNVNRVTDGC
jgi:hypothetical protein